MLRRAAIILTLVAALAGCGTDDDPRPSAAVDDDVFAGEAEAVTGGTVDLSSFADQALVVWFWSPW